MEDYILVYVRNNITYYRFLNLPDIGPEITVGNGTDPQIAVDSLNQCHIVFGALSYARCSGNTIEQVVNVGTFW